MKQPYQWPDINLLTESAWETYDWPLSKDLTDEDMDNFEKKYPGHYIDFNIFMNYKKVAPDLY